MHLTSISAEEIFSHLLLLSFVSFRIYILQIGPINLEVSFVCKVLHAVKKIAQSCIIT